MDYHLLNTVIKNDTYSLLCIDDPLDYIRELQWFILLDLHNGYWQVELADGGKNKTAFGQGLWQVRVMLFRLCNDVQATYGAHTEQSAASIMCGLSHNFLCMLRCLRLLCGNWKKF